MEGIGKSLVLQEEVDESCVVESGVLYRRRRSWIGSEEPWEIVSTTDLKDLPVRVRFDYKNTPDGYLPRKEAIQLDRLVHCGDWAKYTFKCRSCLQAGRDGVLKTLKKELHCGSRYCLNPDCIVERFAKNSDTFSSISRLKNLHNLWHFTIGFPRISSEEFRKNHSSLKKRYEKRMALVWSRLKKRGVEIPALRVFDLAWSKKDDSVYPHYHFGAIPWKSSERRGNMIIFNEIQKDVERRSSDSLTFFMESYGLKDKNGILAYLSKRSAGVYKWDESKNNDFNSNKGKLKKDLVSGKYFGLQDLVSLPEYVKHFHGRRHYASVGGLPRGTMPTNNIETELPNYCPFCKKELERHDIRVCIDLNVPPPPKFSDSY